MDPTPLADHYERRVQEIYNQAPTKIGLQSEMRITKSLSLHDTRPRTSIQVIQHNEKMCQLILYLLLFVSFLCGAYLSSPPLNSRFSSRSRLARIQGIRWDGVSLVYCVWWGLAPMMVEWTAIIIPSKVRSLVVVSWKSSYAASFYARFWGNR